MPNIITSKIILSVGALGLLGIYVFASPEASSAAPAFSKPKSPVTIMQKVDINKDGQITAEEAAIARGKMFDKMDRNQDGFLDKHEQKFARFANKRHKQNRRAALRFDHRAAIDVNQDEQISIEEFVHRASPLFERLDTNKDGFISKKEQQDARKEKFSQLDLNKDGVLSQADRDIAKDQRKAKIETRKAQLDPDGDGRVLRSDFISVRGQMFEKLDVDGNDVLSAQELENRHTMPHGLTPSGHRK